uniref:Goose-type lysozyme 1 n=1 Tax=Mytilus galloprovincialis TaxID=29158 RepID=J7IHB2_MYTGA|nr:goose-type lysozyme 1 [Mytilus galloprovincialis]
MENILVVLAVLVSVEAIDYNCHGNVTVLHPKGMAPKYGGMAASHLAIDRDITEMDKRKSCYLKAAANNCIHPAVIAGIASRESRAGKMLYSTNGWGDHHHAYGIMQCDVRVDPLHPYNKNCTSFLWYSCDHINAMTKYVLVPYIEAVKQKLPSWSDAQALQGGVAAYNFGVRNVRTWDKLDIGTTHNDYSNDVIAQAQWLIHRYNW